MAIQRRTKLEGPPSPAIQVDEDGDDIDVAIEGGVDFAAISVELSKREVEEYRYMSYALGSEGQQPHPKTVPVPVLLAGIQCVQNTGRDGRIEEFYRNRVRSPLTAIRAFCVMNEGGPKAANACQNAACPLWPFKAGKNAYFGRNRGG